VFAGPAVHVHLVFERPDLGSPGPGEGSRFSVPPTGVEPRPAAKGPFDWEQRRIDSLSAIGYLAAVFRPYGKGTEEPNTVANWERMKIQAQVAQFLFGKRGTRK